MPIERTPAGEAARAREIAERLAEYDAREPYSVDVLRDAAPSDIRWLLAERAALAARVEALEKIEAKYQLLRDAVNESGNACPPGCDRYGHEETCMTHEPARWLADQRARIEALESEKREAYAAHAASFGALQAISMLTALNGEVDEYGDVVKAVEALTRDAARLDWLTTHGDYVSRCAYGAPWETHRVGMNGEFEGSTPREAIDAALSAPAEPTPSVVQDACQSDPVMPRRPLGAPRADIVEDR